MRCCHRLLPLCAAAALLIGPSLEAQSPILLQMRSGSPPTDRLVVDSAGGLLVRGTEDRGTIPAEGRGARMMWWPHRAAFRAGTVDGDGGDDLWDAVNVGWYSFAVGRNTTARGYGSTAVGELTSASGMRSVAVGSSTTASGYQSTAMGASTTASGGHSTAMGRHTTASGEYTTAMGRNASTNGMAGSFVYGDSSSGVVSATAPNQFMVRASGGVRLYTSATLASGAALSAGGGSWSILSDRARKQHFLSVDGEDVLARIRSLPISTWRYLAEEDRSVRHIGPMAQDWHRAFGFSSDSLHINSGDFAGVNLAGIQALDRRDRRQQQEIDVLRDESAQLRLENEGLRTEMTALRQQLEERLRRVEQTLHSATAQEL
jgi:trimeric autotransporter adhesin